MFGIGSTELIVILVVALLVLGPKKLPEIARSLGKGMAEFRRMSTDVKRTIEMESDRAEEEKKKKEVKEELLPEKEQAKAGTTPSDESPPTAKTTDAEQDQVEKKA
jgi:sec-independent protein translocase protein TatB